MRSALRETTCDTNSPIDNGLPYMRCASSQASSAFVTKISADGTSLVYSTYLHGLSGNEAGAAVAVDSAGNDIILGSTSSNDFPITEDAYQSLRNTDSTFQHLSLCNISLFSACKAIMSAVCMEKLRSLKLIHCHHTFRFLKKLAKSTHAFRLNSFEVVFDEYSSVSGWYDGNTNPIGEFLMTFEGLEELYISTQNSNSTIGAFLDPILHHRFSLTRLVHHDRGVDMDEESDRFELFRDFPLPWEEVVPSCS